jgi:hypothetical protein
MAQPLPKWLFIRYSKIWKEKNSTEFKYDEIRDLLREKDDRSLSVVLSELRKYGWLEATLDQSDSRKRVYKLRNPKDIVNEIADNK